MRKHGTEALVIRTVSRDGAWAFAILAAYLAYSLPYAFAKQVIRHMLYSHGPPMFFLLWVIINLQCIDLGSMEESLNTLQFMGATPDDITPPPFLTADDNINVTR
ncbi:hypothetical protein BDQ17DRAFT_1333819 [Cyathus striatus]|nr:hypothetical protein BDQ17DRAFT_1333819 [Cyathus striatus]